MWLIAKYIFECKNDQRNKTDLLLVQGNPIPSTLEENDQLLSPQFLSSPKFFQIDIENEKSLKKGSFRSRTQRSPLSVGSENVRKSILVGRSKDGKMIRFKNREELSRSTPTSAP
ncbi:hypothetical protein HZH66_001735 [Vespula vulgaris]|uniref:Uncharacterized protein n=1 Tax=Vespula vulgaris TaxID=7454 RepID=A0A834KIH6_VESVU|nr:hypothetical protein HZH66_001735 [Vespula vulgaris]